MLSLSQDILEFSAIVVALMISSFYAAAEAALISIPHMRAKQIVSEGGKRSLLMKFWLSHSNQILTTILIGCTLINMFIGALSANIAHRYFGEESLAISVGCTTFLVLVFGEIIPKMMGRGNERLYFPALLTLKFNYYAFYPVVTFFCYGIKKFLGENAEFKTRLVTKDDIEFLVNEAEKIKTIDSKQIDLLSSILEFPMIKVKDIMVPRSKVNYIKREQSFTETMHFLKKHGHSRYPVCDDDLDNVVGLIHVKDIALINLQQRGEQKIDKFLKSPLFVYEHMKIQMVFDYMNRKKVHLALVKNENGIVVGIVTLEDIIEEIFGEIADEHDDEDHEKNTEQVLARGVLVAADISLRDLYNDYDIKIPLNDNYSTLSGFILDHIGNHFPKKGMLIFWENYCFKLEQVDKNEIKKILITDIEGEKHLFSRKMAEHASNSKNQEDPDDPLD